MSLRLTVLFLAFSYSSMLAQETFPVNGVSSSFEPIFAFTNAHLIISPEKEIQKGTLLIQGDKIIAADSNVTIPEGTIIKDLDGDFDNDHEQIETPTEK